MTDDMDNRDLYSGMIRLHILHHAEQEAIFGAGMAEELARHGYKIRLEPSNCGSWSGRTWLLKVRKGAANQSDQEWLNRLVESANFEL